MTSLTVPAPPSPTTPLTVREQEQVDENKTADDAPAPAHSPEERKVLVRDAYGNNPDGTVDAPELGQSPRELPDPRVDALRGVKPSSDQEQASADQARTNRP